MYDFETLKPRRGIGAEKWAGLEELGAEDPNLVPLSVADMEFSAAPRIQEAMGNAASFGVYGYTAADATYRAAVCGWMDRRHGWRVEPEWMFQTYGVLPGINLAIHALTRPGDGVIIQPPVYPPFRKVIENTGRTACLNPLVLTGSGYEMDFDALERLATQPEVKLLLLCSPHNPVGRVWRREELQRVADLCSWHGVTVFSDEIHADFIHPGHIYIPFATLEGESPRRSITGTAASKTFNLAGLSTANIIVPNAALRKALRAKEVGYTGEFTNYFGLTATRVAYESCGDWLDALLPVIRGNYEYCKASLAEKFPSLSVSPLEGTYLLWADFNSLGLDEESLTRFFERARLFLSAGGAFGVEGEGFRRFNLACPRRCLVDAMARLSAAAKQL